MSFNFRKLWLALLIVTTSSFQISNVETKSLDNFIIKECRLSYPKEITYFLLVEPQMCASCNAQYIKRLSKYSKEYSLLVFCDSLKKKEIATYISNPNVKYITKFNYAWLGKQSIMRSGLAFAKIEDKTIKQLDVINYNNIKKFE